MFVTRIGRQEEKEKTSALLPVTVLIWNVPSLDCATWSCCR